MYTINKHKNSQPVWMPFSTAPRDGTFFICYNGADFQVVNYPKGCVLGRWYKTKGEWYGTSIVTITPTHWMPLPDPPLVIEPNMEV